MRIPYAATKAHAEGWDAFFNEKKIPVNPYPYHQANNRQEWEDGYKSAREYEKTVISDEEMEE